MKTFVQFQGFSCPAPRFLLLARELVCVCGGGGGGGGGGGKGECQFY